MEKSLDPTLLKLSKRWRVYKKCKGSLEKRNKKLYKFYKAAEAAGFTSTITRYLIKSAQTCARAMYKLGILNESGKWGVTCNDDAAESWFTCAAERGHYGAKKKLEQCAAKKAQTSP
jgi:TPR repeat protein